MDHAVAVIFDRGGFRDVPARPAAKGRPIQTLYKSVKACMLRSNCVGEQLVLRRTSLLARQAPHGIVIAPQANENKAGRWSECVVEVARLRDRARFRELFDYFAPRLKSFFLRMGVAPAAAEDLAQETMLAVWNKAAQFDPERASASTWIFTIARNLRIDMNRRERDPGKFAAVFEAEPEPSPSDHLLTAEQETRIRAAIAALPEDQAAVIRLSFFSDRAHSEIAGVLSIPLGTVKSRIRLAMSRLRALVEDDQ